MSFTTIARHVRDPALPHRRRVSALRSCTRRYCPIGFPATLSFLEELAGPFARDEAALLRALDHLEASRARWQADVRLYAGRRRAAKRLGRRTPHPAEPNPANSPAIWYGAPVRAALHALGHWRRQRLPAVVTWDDPGARDIDAAVTAVLATGGPLLAAHQDALTAAVALQRHRLQGDLYRSDYAAYHRALSLLQVAHLVTTAAKFSQEIFGEPVVEPPSRSTYR